jgi:O-antigen/teichoic acid export membrane protein
MTSIKSKVIDGLKWSVLSKLVAQLISWSSTFLVINLLNPNDFAVLAICTAILGFVNIVANTYM